MQISRRLSTEESCCHCIESERKKNDASQWLLQMLIHKWNIYCAGFVDVILCFNDVSVQQSWTQFQTVSRVSLSHLLLGWRRIQIVLHALTFWCCSLTGSGVVTTRRSQTGNAQIAYPWLLSNFTNTLPFCLLCSVNFLYDAVVRYV